MKITFVWSAGGPANWNDSNLESGLGGSESMVTQYAREFAKQGHEVTVLSPGTYGVLTLNGVTWKSINNWAPETWPVIEGDVVVSGRTPDPLQYAHAKIRAMLCNDQVGHNLPLAVESGWVDVIITISQHQKERYMGLYPQIPESMYFVSSAGVKVDDFVPEEKVYGQCVYSATPERGLGSLCHIWPPIVNKNHDARLIVTSGFQLYGFDEQRCQELAGSTYEYLRTLKHVVCLGKPYTRKEYCSLLKKSTILLYPSIYDEMCCIGALEAAAAEMPIITTKRAALAERVVDGITGYLIDGTPGTPEYNEMFVTLATELLFDDDKRIQMGKIARHIVQKHDYKVLVGQWINKFQTG